MDTFKPQFKPNQTAAQAHQRRHSCRPAPAPEILPYFMSPEVFQWIFSK